MYFTPSDFLEQQLVFTYLGGGVKKVHVHWAAWNLLREVKQTLSSRVGQLRAGSFARASQCRGGHPEQVEARGLWFCQRLVHAEEKVGE